MPTRLDQAWVGDITYIPMGSSWVYLAVVIDLCSRRVVGWSLGENMRSELVVAALRQAVQSRPKLSGTIFHSDRGSQYSGAAFRTLLEASGMRQSMSARANPYDNAWAESFIGTLKREMLQGGRFSDLVDARTEIFDYIEAYFNNHRKHSSIGYKTPAQFEKQISVQR